MRKKIFFYSSLIPISLIIILFISLASQTSARNSGAVYFSRTENGFPCGGLCSAYLDFKPQGSETGCGYICDNNWSISCTVPPAENPNWPYVNFTRTCRLTGNCGCDVNKKCPGTTWCATSNRSWNNSSCTGSCCTAAESSSYTQCIECYQYFDDNGVLKNYNRCSVKGKCGDPCDLPVCPSLKCEIYDKNGDGDTDEYNDYKCVLASATSEAKSATASTGATGQSCCDKVATGNYFYCPAGQKDGCCPAKPKQYQCCGKKAKNAVCCKPSPDETCKSTWIPLLGTINYCKPNTCPSSRPVFCPGSKQNACCLPGSGCSESKTGVAFCNNNDGCTKDHQPPGTFYCTDNLCCITGKEECLEEYKIYVCQPIDENQCKPDETFCPGTGESSKRKKCCLPEESCEHHPNGYPYCYNPNE